MTLGPARARQDDQPGSGGNGVPPGAPATLGREREVAVTLVSADEGTDVITRAVAAAKAGSGDAARYLYVRFADEVYGYVRTIVYDDHEAQDVTQQVFSELIGALHEYEEREMPFPVWVLGMARDVALDTCARGGRVA